MERRSSSCLTLVYTMNHRRPRRRKGSVPKIKERAAAPTKLLVGGGFCVVEDGVAVADDTTAGATTGVVDETVVRRGRRNSSASCNSSTAVVRRRRGRRGHEGAGEEGGEEVGFDVVEDEVVVAGEGVEEAAGLGGEVADQGGVVDGVEGVEDVVEVGADGVVVDGLAVLPAAGHGDDVEVDAEPVDEGARQDEEVPDDVEHGFLGAGDEEVDAHEVGGAARD
mmetsp:Transcript_7345/g.22624  ORF Transcript_7345/g.22624 Transcript_7345/m.22624 type:complete len:223 (+) Transcript_7345:494-1162(+)